MKVLFCLRARSTEEAESPARQLLASQAQDVGADHPGLERDIPIFLAQVFS